MAMRQKDPSLIQLDSVGYFRELGHGELTVEIRVHVLIGLDVCSVGLGLCPVGLSVCSVGQDGVCAQ